MSTRARTRAAAAAAAAAVIAPSTTSPYAGTAKPSSKPSVAKDRPSSTVNDTVTSSTKQQEQQSDIVTESYTEKEMASSTTVIRPTTTAKKQSQPKSKAILRVNVAYCTCHRGDDGSPMIRCAECKLWCVTRVAWALDPILCL